MKIVCTSDENYVQHLSVSLLSLLESNQSATELKCYIISNNISKDSCRELEKLAARYERQINWIDFAPFKARLELNMAWQISISSYARLFLQEMLPESIERVLYLDCDTVVCDSLQSLFELDLGDCCVGGVRDFISASLKKAVELSEDATYINAGILLIDLQAWRRDCVLDSFLGYIDSQNGRVIHHDQGVVNHCLHDRIHVLHPRFNAMTPLFTQSFCSIQTIWGEYYTRSVYREAIDAPTIIHFTPGFTTQVWDVKCRHPLRERYFHYLDQTIWNGRITDKHVPFKYRIINWIALNMPKIYAHNLG